MSFSAVPTPFPYLSLRQSALLIAAVSAVALAGAWVFEWAGYKPCPLCLEERVPYYAAVALGLVAAWAAERRSAFAALLLAVVCAALFYNAGVGIYHAGAEWHFWPGPETCGGGDVLQAGGSLAERLRRNSPIRCDEAALRIAGVSLAGYSAVISAALAGVGVAALRQSWNTRAGSGA